MAQLLHSVIDELEKEAQSDQRVNVTLFISKSLVKEFKQACGDRVPVSRAVESLLRHSLRDREQKK